MVFPVALFAINRYRKTAVTGFVLFPDIKILNNPSDPKFHTKSLFHLLKICAVSPCGARRPATSTARFTEKTLSYCLYKSIRFPRRRTSKSRAYLRSYKNRYLFPGSLERVSRCKFLRVLSTQELATHTTGDFLQSLPVLGPFLHWRGLLWSVYL